MFNELPTRLILILHINEAIWNNYALWNLLLRGRLDITSNQMNISLTCKCRLTENPMILNTTVHRSHFLMENSGEKTTYSLQRSSSWWIIMSLIGVPVWDLCWLTLQYITSSGFRLIRFGIMEECLKLLLCHSSEYYKIQHTASTQHKLKRDLSKTVQFTIAI